MERHLYERVIVCGAPELATVRPVLRTMSHMLETGVFWYGDNIEVMREHLTGDGEVDLIYLDPPFNSNRIHNAIFVEEDESLSKAQLTAFADYWRWGREANAAFDECVVPRRRYLVSASFVETMQMLRRALGDSNMMAYLSMMAVRLIEMKRLLKPAGSLYLHCDPTASHYLKLILDALFGLENFRNEIIWKRTGANNSAKRFGPVHDTILFYGKTDAAVCQPTPGEYSEQYRERFNKWDDVTDAETGEVRRRYFQDVTLTGSGTRNGDSGHKWREFDITKRGRHWAIPGVVYDNYKDTFGIDLHDYPILERLDRVDEAGLLYWSEQGRGGLPRYKFFDDDAAGAPLQDVWTDIHALNSQSLERKEAGYPTQKPVELLARIIDASSKEGDVVLDPFCGCGTAVVAAQRLKRRWIGIDITHLAVSVLKRRLDRHFPGLEYRVRGEPVDAASARKLAADKPLEFQAWIVDAVGGIPVGSEKEKKVAKGGGDEGRDGFILFQDDPKSPRSKRMLLSVKGGPSYVDQPRIVDELRGAMTNHGATLGALLMSHEPSGGTYKRAAGYGTWASETYATQTRFPVIQIVTLDDVFMHGWRLQLPGANTSRTSQPPPGTPGASEELFDATGQPKKRAKPGVKKPSMRPPAPEQTEIQDVSKAFRLTPKRSRK